MPDKVTFRFKDDQQEAARMLDKLAAERGVSANDLARELLLAQLDSGPVTRPGGAELAALTVEVAELKVVITELSKLVGAPPKGVKVARRETVRLREDLATMFSAWLIRFAKADKAEAEAWVARHLSPKGKERGGGSKGTIP